MVNEASKLRGKVPFVFHLAPHASRKLHRCNTTGLVARPGDLSLVDSDDIVMTSDTKRRIPEPWSPGISTNSVVSEGRLVP